MNVELMDKALKIAFLMAGAWAALKPTLFAAIFAFVGHRSAVLDMVVVASCLVIVWGAFRRAPLYLWVGSVLVLMVSSFAGFFHHFKDSGESGPLPYEWLNGYFQFSLPLVVLVVIDLFRNRMFGRD